MRPLFEAYSYLMRCKNLGITIPADAFDTRLVTELQTIQESVEDMHDKMNKARSRGDGG